MGPHQPPDPDLVLDPNRQPVAVLVPDLNLQPGEVGEVVLVLDPNRQLVAMVHGRVHPLQLVLGLVRQRVIKQPTHAQVACAEELPPLP